MADAFKAAVEALPKILESLKKIGKAAGTLGLNWDDFSDPRLIAAAAAFRYAPGGLPGKVIAGLVAYTAADYYGEATDPNSALNNVGPGLIGNQQGLRKAFLTNGADANTSAGMAWNSYITGGGKKVKGYANLYGQGVSVNGTTVVVNGAIDPNATATAVQRVLSKAEKAKILNQNVTAPSF